jgi:hypothetical protein
LHAFGCPFHLIEGAQGAKEERESFDDNAQQQHQCATPTARRKAVPTKRFGGPNGYATSLWTVEAV